MQCARSSVPTVSAHRERMLEKAGEGTASGCRSPCARRLWELRRNIAGENGHGACVSVGAVTLALHPRLTPRWRPKRSTTRRVFVDEWIVFFTWWLLDFQYAMIQIF